MLRLGQVSARARLSATESQAAGLASAALVEPRSDTAVLLSRQALALPDTPATRGDLLSNLIRQNGLVRIIRPGVRPLTNIRANTVSTHGRHMVMNSSDGVFLVDLAVRGSTSAAQLAGTDDPVLLEPVAEPSLGTGLVAYVAGLVDDGRKRCWRTRGTILKSQGREMVAFNAASGQQVGAAQPLPGSLSTHSRFDRPQVSPDGRTLLSVVNRTVRVWHRTSWGGSGPRRSLCRLCPRRCLTGTTSARCRSAPTAQGPSSARDPGAPVQRPAAPGGRRRHQLTTSHTRVGHPASGRTLVPRRSRCRLTGRPLAIGDHDGWVELRDLSAAHRPAKRIAGSSAVSALGWSADGGSIVVGHDDGSLAVYAARLLQVVARFGGLGAAVWFTAFVGSSGRLVSQDETGAIAAYSLDGSDQLIRTVPTGRASAMAVGPSGSVVALGREGGRVDVYDQNDPTRQLLSLSLGPYPERDLTADPAAHRTVSALAITADGSAIIAGDRVGHLKMWSLRDGRLLWRRTDLPTSSLAVSPDGTRLATSGFRQEPTDRNADGRSIAHRIHAVGPQDPNSLGHGRLPLRRQLRRGCAARSTQAPGAVVLPGLDACRCGVYRRPEVPDRRLRRCARPPRCVASCYRGLADFHPRLVRAADSGPCRGITGFSPYGHGRSSISLHRPAVTAAFCSVRTGSG